MKKRLDVGTFVRIPLEDGSFGYGRILSDPYVTLYNYNTGATSVDLDSIAAAPILFTVGVRLPTDGSWANLGSRPLEGAVAKPVVQFRQDVADFRKCVVFDSDGMVREVSPEECVGLERAASWEPHHIQRRLLDTFAGRPNDTEIRLRVRLAPGRPRGDDP